MKKIVVIEKNGVCVPIQITPIFRKVFTKDRLPNVKDGEWIDTSLGGINFFSNHIKDGVWKYNIHTIEWWLEEIILPTDEELEKQFPTNFCEPRDIKGINDDNLSKQIGAEWMRDFVLAGKAVTANVLHFCEGKIYTNENQ